MTVTKTQLPLTLRVLNGAIAGFNSLGLQVPSLSPDTLMRRAQKQARLNDFGSDYFLEPLRLLCRSLEEDAHLTGLGRSMAQQDILRLLRNRLQFVDLFKRHPEIADQEITAPIFILGMPRTGTTSLHELMALDPQFRVPLSWEVAQPFPPPETATYKTDPRIAQLTTDLSRVDSLLPGFKDMHPMGADLPQECVALFAYDFTSMIFDVQFRLQQYQAWVVQEDMAEVFRNHRRWLQLLQWKCPADTWVLKSPQYLWNIDDMLREYPDARIVQTHRDPVKVALSVGSLVNNLRGLGSNHTSIKETTQVYADLLHYGTGKTMRARSQGDLAPNRAFDVQFPHFRKDPVAAIQEVYDYFNIALSAETAKKMQIFLDKGNESERHGKHQYSLQNSGLDLDKERARFADYQREYAVASEAIA